MLQRQTDGVCPETVLLRSTCPEESHKALEGKPQEGEQAGGQVAGVESDG